jgi:hypothetical protein
MVNNKLALPFISRLEKSGGRLHFADKPVALKVFQKACCKLKQIALKRDFSGHFLSAATPEKVGFRPHEGPF